MVHTVKFDRQLVLIGVKMLFLFSFSTHVMVPHRKFVLKVPESIPLDIACMLPCSGITAYSAMQKTKAEIERVTQYEGKSRKSSNLILKYLSRSSN